MIAKLTGILLFDESPLSQFTKNSKTQFKASNQGSSASLAGPELGTAQPQLVITSLPTPTPRIVSKHIQHIQHIQINYNYCWEC